RRAAPVRPARHELPLRRDTPPPRLHCLRPTLHRQAVTGRRVTSAQALGRCTSTGTCALRITLSATLPRNRRDSPRRPCVFIATRSTASWSASCRLLVT